MSATTQLTTDEILNLWAPLGEKRVKELRLKEITFQGSNGAFSIYVGRYYVGSYFHINGRYQVRLDGILKNELHHVENQEQAKKIVAEKVTAYIKIFIH